MSSNKSVVLTEPFFKLIVKVLKLLGLWRISYSTPILILSWCHISGTAIFLILLEFAYIVLDIDQDDTEVIKTIGTVLFHIGCTSRMLQFLYCVPKAPKLLRIAQRKSFDFENLYVTPVQKQTEELETNLIDTRKNAIKMQYDKIVKHYRFTSFTLFWMMAIGAYMSMAFSYISTLLLPEKYFDEVLNVTIKEYRLPYNSYHFLNLKNTISFIFEMTYQCYALGFMCTCIITVDLFFYGIIIHVTAQSVVLQMILENTVIYRNKSENAASERQIDKCLKEAAEIAKINNLLQDVLENVLLLQYSLAVFIICTLIYIVESSSEYQLFKLAGYFLFLFEVALEPLITCLIFQNLTIEYAKLADAIYFLNWDDASPSLRKKLTIAISCFQKPLVVKIFHLVPLNTDMFINVMKMAYSFYTLMSQTR